MTYNFSALNRENREELKKKLISVLSQRVEPNDLVNIFNAISSLNLCEILPNECDYIDDYFEGKSAYWILGYINTEKITYRHTDDYFTVRNNELLSFKAEDVLDYLKTLGCLEDMATYLVDNKKDFLIDSIRDVMKEYNLK